LVTILFPHPQPQPFDSKEISEKVQKSLITWIINALENKEKSVESFFGNLCNQRAKSSFSELSQIILDGKFKE